VLPEFSNTDGDILSGQLDDVFLVPGQGVDPFGALASDFLADNQTVRHVLSVVDAVAVEHGYPAVTGLVLGHDAPSGQRDGAEQIAGYAASVAVLALLRERSLHPSAVVAQSMGEIAALVASGVYSVETGVRAVCLMNDAYASHPCEGGLVIAATDEQGARDLIGRVGSDDLVVAGVNTARQTLLGGGEEAVASLLNLVGQQGAPVLRRLPVQYVTHHPRLEPIARQFESALRLLPVHPLQVPLYSVVGRRWYTEDEDFCRALADCVTKPMHLRESLEQFSAHLPERFIEVGAGDNMGRAARALVRGSYTVAPLGRDLSWLSELIGPSAASVPQS
jgi:acyl-CoA oxidase